MDMLLAIEAEVVLAMLASSCILFALDYRSAAASGNRAPAHVIHCSDGVLNAELFILFHHFTIQVQVLDIEVIQALKALWIGAFQLADLPLVDFRNDHVGEALGAVIVLTACQERELISK